MDAIFPLLFRRPSWQLALCAFLTICSASTLITSPASAHTLKTDGAISAVLHFEPDDDPISDKPSEYILFLSDSTKRFSMGECDCTVTVKKGAKIISAKPMQLNHNDMIGSPITFPEAGIFEVTFQGSPTKSGTFQPFTLRYLERVLPNPTADHPSLTFVIGISVVVVIMVVIAFLIKVQMIPSDKQRGG